MRLVDASGTIVAAYTYDPYGNILTATGDLAQINPLRYRGYYFDAELGMYFLNSRYYDPAIGRFLNGDSYVSTGQGILGNNMLAYCCNNPVAYSDGTGLRMECVSAEMAGGGLPYITDQEEDNVGYKQFGLTSVSHGGCGIVASYNARISLGDYTAFDNVLAYYNNHIAITPGYGFTGLSPRAIANYFKDLGYSVRMTDAPDLIDLLSETADASILYYMFPKTYPIIGDAYGAHFVEYHKFGDEYVGVNTSDITGISKFTIPSDYSSQNQRYYAIGIFIYK